MIHTEPGIELDALVAEKVMGIPKEHYCMDHALLSSLKEWNPKELLNYSTDIAAAMRITKKMCNTWVMHWHDCYSEWQVRCDHQRSTMEGCRYEAWHPELPTAICLAALRALGNEL